MLICSRKSVVNVIIYDCLIVNFRNHYQPVNGYGYKKMPTLQNQWCCIVRLITGGTKSFVSTATKQLPRPSRSCPTATSCRESGTSTATWTSFTFCGTKCAGPCTRGRHFHPPALEQSTWRKGWELVHILRITFVILRSAYGTEKACMRPLYNSLFSFSHSHSTFTLKAFFLSSSHFNLSGTLRYSRRRNTRGLNYLVFPN